MEKANTAQAGGATGLLVINDNEGITRMCHVFSFFCPNSLIFQIYMQVFFTESNLYHVSRALQDGLR